MTIKQTEVEPGVTVVETDGDGARALVRGAIAAGWFDDEELVNDQPCAFGERLGGHAVYCGNDAWSDKPRKCRRTWYTGGKVRDEDCEGFVPRILADTDALPNAMTWNLVREGSRLWLTNGKERHSIAIDRVEEIARGALNMVRDAKHWKERGE